MTNPRQIHLRGGGFTLVDEADYERLVQWTWHAHTPTGKAKAYVRRHIRVDGHQLRIYMHREILGLKRGDRTQVDHRNGDTLDNRRANLRCATQSQNLHNAPPNKASTSGVKGVGWVKAKKKWRARIKVQQRRHSLGYFDTKEEAAAAYARAAGEMVGEFAWPS